MRERGREVLAYTTFQYVLFQHRCDLFVGLCSEQPCQNGAKCSPRGQNNYVCECQEGFVGKPTAYILKLLSLALSPYHYVSSFHFGMEFKLSPSFLICPCMLSLRKPMFVKTLSGSSFQISSESLISFQYY